jgi:hypothetical protein
MTAHELARLLLSGPDYTVVVYNYETRQTRVVESVQIVGERTDINIE